MKFLFIVLKLLNGGLAFLGMYFTSHFWIGTEQQWQAEINKGFWEFFFSRLLFTLIIGGLFFLVSLLLNWIFRKKVNYGKNKNLVELSALIFISIVMVSITMMK